MFASRLKQWLAAAAAGGDVGRQTRGRFGRISPLAFCLDETLIFLVLFLGGVGLALDWPFSLGAPKMGLLFAFGAHTADLHGGARRVPRRLLLLALGTESLDSRGTALNRQGCRPRRTHDFVRDAVGFPLIRIVLLAYD